MRWAGLAGWLRWGCAGAGLAGLGALDLYLVIRVHFFIRDSSGFHPGFICLAGLAWLGWLAGWAGWVADWLAGWVDWLAAVGLGGWAGLGWAGWAGWLAGLAVWLAGLAC